MDLILTVGFLCIKNPLNVFRAHPILIRLTVQSLLYPLIKLSDKNIAAVRVCFVEIGFYTHFNCDVQCSLILHTPQLCQGRVLTPLVHFGDLCLSENSHFVLVLCDPYTTGTLTMDLTLIGDHLNTAVQPTICFALGCRASAVSFAS